MGWRRVSGRLGWSDPQRQADGVLSRMLRRGRQLGMVRNFGMKLPVFMVAFRILCCLPLLTRMPHGGPPTFDYTETGQRSRMQGNLLTISARTNYTFPSAA